MEKREVEIVVHLRLGVVALEMIIGGGVLHLAADLQDGEASPAAGAGHFLETEGERDHCLVREITSRLDPSLGLGADLGQMKENRRPVHTRSGVQEITSFDRSMYRKFKFCLRLHKLGAFLRCFSWLHLSLGTVPHKDVNYGLKWIIETFYQELLLYNVPLSRIEFALNSNLVFMYRLTI